MLTSVEMTALLRAQDPLVFTGDVPALQSAAFALASTDFEGAVVLLPETLPSDPAAAVPALLFSRVNRLRDWQVPQRQNMALVLIQEHGASLQSLAFFKEAPPDNRQGAPYRFRGDTRTSPHRCHGHFYDHVAAASGFAPAL
jgi:hypothetical protein